MESINTDISPVRPEINSQPIIPKPNKSFPFVLFLGIAIGITLTVSVVSAVYYFSTKKTSIQTDNSNPEIQNITPTDEPLSSPTPGNFTKVNWLNQPQMVSNPKVFTQSEKLDQDEVFVIYFNKITTYLIGKLDNGSELLKIIIPSNGLGKDYEQTCRLIKSPDGKLSFLSQEQQDCDLNEYLLPEISRSDILFKEFTLPESFEVNKITFNRGYSTNGKTLSQLINPKLIGSSDYGNLYVVYTPKKDITNVYIQSFYLELKDKTLYSYNIKTSGILNDDLSNNVNWADNNQTTEIFNRKLSSDGCGNSYFGNDVIKDGSSLIQNKVEVGTFGQSKVYQIKDINNPLVKRIYALYQELISFDSNKNDLNINDFVNTKNHFLYQDQLGDWVIYINESYTITAECGKPVIYLYPQQETQVKVQVGAQITKSEPTYPEKGWSVTAKPSGELTYQDQSYPYLFWEGLGNGIYPDYKDQGTLVSQKELISTLYKQLSQLGLNQKESADFMEFWQPKLPKTPYVRLTWLNTKDMDTLAPLAVTPRPETSIRIFLEFQGLEKPIKLIPQTLSAPRRQGFTLIEWGGLLLKNKE